MVVVVAEQKLYCQVGGLGDSAEAFTSALKSEMNARRPEKILLTVAVSVDLSRSPGCCCKIEN